MRIDHLSKGLVLGLALAGCGGGGGGGYPGGGDGGIPAPGGNPDLAQSQQGCGATAFNLPGQNVIYRILPGSGITGVTPGQDVGYFITANNGGSYRLVWTGSANAMTMRGAVFTTGQFRNFVPGCNGAFCKLGPNDCVTQPTAVQGGQRIDFLSRAGASILGFDFVASAEPVYFNLLVNEQPRPELVFFPATDNGGQVSNAGGIPFGLTTQ